jgi:hypothetical protein
MYEKIEGSGAGSGSGRPKKTCGFGSPTLHVIRCTGNSGFESVSDEDLSGESSTDGEEGKGGAPPRRKLTKISDRDLSELKSDDGVTFLHFPFLFQASKLTIVVDSDPVDP